MILRPLEGPTGTGPIDNLVMHETKLECPACNAFDVWHIPEQSGSCHSGQFHNTCIEHYWCEACEASLTDAP
ncbi:hypothetical protein D9M71_148510 [compost metagenome]